jgi:hypothetical protein
LSSPSQSKKLPPPPTHSQKFSAAQKLDELWRRGIVAKWQCHVTQIQMYEAFKANPEKLFVINSSRRLGKSYLLCVIAIETALQNDNCQIKFAAPTQKMVRKIIMPLMRQILDTCPKHLQPRANKVDGLYEFPNGSEIHIAGTEQAQADNLRGTACDLAIIDEAAFASDLRYMIESILRPQMLTRPNARIILASTPPVTPDHDFMRYAEEAMEAGAYVKFTIYDNPLLTTETIEKYKKEAGGENTSTWKREYLAEFVTDTDSALIPEATQECLAEITAEVIRPEFFNPISALDLGFVDATGGLLAYYNFQAGKVVIEDEFLINKATTAVIVDLATSKEKALWGTQAPRRVVDGNALLIADLNSDTYKFRCHAPDKADLVAGVNRIRMEVSNKSLVIHPRCKNLLHQLQHATWDKSRTRFSRSSNGNHWDLVAALIYLLKAVDRKSNPFPAGHGWDRTNAWGVPRQHQNSTINLLGKMFPVGRRGK